MTARIVLIALFSLVVGCANGPPGQSCYRGACQDLPPDAPAITDVSVRTAREGSRVRIISTQPLAPYMFSLATGGDRVVLDYPRVEWRMGGRANAVGQQVGRGGGLVEQYRFADFSSVTSRLVFDLRGPALASQAQTRRLMNGRHEYSFVLRSVDRAAFVAASGYKGPTRGGGDRRSLSPSTFVSAPPVSTDGPGILNDVSADRGPASSLVRGRGPFVVVIDPGHGGRDQGAASASGVIEKELNLAVARLLRASLLQHPQYTVVMTRDDDRAVSLPDRLSWARQSNADLFISIHADSLRSGAMVHGASVYTLSEGGVERSRSEILGENNWIIGVDLNDHDPGVGEILVDLSQTRTNTESDYLAQGIIHELGQIGPLVRNTHRLAQYYVLLAPDVPAVLVEMGFLSSPRDAARLAKPQEQQRVADALARAVNTYYNERAR